MTERRVMVTGASSGFGLATALHLAELGFTVTGLVPDQAGESALEEAAADHHVEVQTLKADLASPQRRAAAVNGMELYALVNNAGYLNAGLLRDVEIADARIQFEVMVLGPMDLARRMLPHMVKHGEGRIVNVTSAAVHTSTPVTGWYQACKAALRELTDALRVELEDTGVDVVDIEPGGFRTGIWERGQSELRKRQRKTDRPEAYEASVDLIQRTNPHMGDPTEVARAIGQALTQSRPRSHIRVGRDAGPLRLMADILPDRIWDRLVTGPAGVS